MPPPKGYKQTEEHKRKRAESQRGRRHSAETCALLSAQRKGRKPSALCREKSRERCSQIGAAHPAYKGGSYVNKAGYRLVLVGPWQYRLEHRVVMEEVLGRPLLRQEVVHHVDDDKQNNDPSNLMLFPNNAAHLRFHHERARAA